MLERRVPFEPVPIAGGWFAFSIVNTVLAITGFISVGTRVIFQKYLKNGLSWDDYMILLALPCVITLCVMNFLLGTTGIGYNSLLAIPPENDALIEQLGKAYFSFYTWGMFFIRLSVLLLYLRLFSISENNVKKTVIILGIVLVILNFGCFIATFVLCLPGSLAIQCDHGWDVLGVTLASVASVVDLVIFTLPAYWLWSLRIPPKTRVALTLMFCSGVIVSMIAVGRLFVTSMTGLSHKFDFWVGYQLLNLEAGVGLVVACLPNLRAVLRLKLRSSTGSTPEHTQFSARKFRSNNYSHRGRSDNLSTAETICYHESDPTGLSKPSPIPSRTVLEDDSSTRELLAMPSYPMASYPPPPGNHFHEPRTPVIYVEQKFSVRSSPVSR